MKIQKIQQVSSSEKTIYINTPTSWDDLTPNQFRLCCSLLALETEREQLPTLALIRLNNIRVLAQQANQQYLCQIKDLHGKTHIETISAETIAAATRHTQWIIQIPKPTELRRNLRTIHNSAIEPTLDTLSFGQYLTADNYFTGYLQTTRPDLLLELLKILFPRRRSTKIEPWEAAAIILWFSAAKQRYFDLYPEFYAEGNAADSSDPFAAAHIQDTAAATDAQIRALTKGDITKEEEVLARPVRRALSELNQLAREYREFNSNVKC